MRRSLLPMVLLALCPAHSASARIVYLAVSDGTWQIWQMQLDGRRARQVTRGTADVARISCAADGNRILATTNQGRLEVVDAATGAVTPLAVPASLVLDGAISPDGSRIAFSFARADSIDANDLFVIGLDGTGLRKVFGLPALQHEPAWSRDGRWLYFASGDGGAAHDLWRVNMDDGSGEQLTVSARYNFDVATGPDDVFVFSSNRSGDYELWMARPKATPVRLTEHPGLDARPSVSTDGRDIVYERVDDGVSNVWRLPVNSRKPVQLTRTREGARGPVWCGGSRR